MDCREGTELDRKISVCKSLEGSDDMTLRKVLRCALLITSLRITSLGLCSRIGDCPDNPTADRTSGAAGLTTGGIAEVAMEATAEAAAGLASEAPTGATMVGTTSVQPGRCV